MSKICVPYRDKDLPSPKFRLYSVTMKKRQDLSCWNIMPSKTVNEEINERFKNLQIYCENLYRVDYPADFHLRTINKVNNSNEYITELDKHTTSVFLGIFLKAVLQITGRKFKEDWEIICATGDLKYNEKDEKLHLVPIGDVPEKYTDEFTAIAEENKDKKCLFLYISDKEEKEIPQGINGNIIVKWFSPNDAIDDIFDYLFNGIFPPINYKVSLNRENVIILKKYLVRSYLEDSKNIDFSDNVVVPDFNEYQILDFFEGYISASLCFLHFYEEMFRDIRDGKYPEDLNIYGGLIYFLQLMGTVNESRRETAVDIIIPQKIDDDYVLKTDILLPIERISDYCPPRQSKIFYAAWNRFCMLFCGYSSYTKKNDQNFSPSKLKYKVLDSLGYCLNKYLEKYYYNVFLIYVNIYLFISNEFNLNCEFKIEGFKELIDDIEKKLNNIYKKKKNELTWNEWIVQTLNYNDDDKKNIENILGGFKDKERGLLIAVNFLFAKKM